MKLQRFNTLTLFIFLITTLSTYSMKSNRDAHELEEVTCNDFHPLLCCPRDIQQQIFFPQYTNDTMITFPKMDELKEVIKTFFVLNSVCKHLNKNFKLPWADLDREKKNRMLKKAISYLVGIGDDGYKKYRIVPLALVYSGANADTRPRSWSTSLVRAVSNEDELAVAMLLEHNANPYQCSDQYCEENRMPICFAATTVSMIRLFLDKVDKDILLSKSTHAATWNLIDDKYPPEVMAFWLDYGLNVRYIHTFSCCILHELVRSVYWHVSSFDNVLTKGKLLLKYIPDMVNTINLYGSTPLDEAMIQKGRCETKTDFYVQLIELFRQHDGKTAKELAENAHNINET